MADGSQRSTVGRGLSQRLIWDTLPKVEFEPIVGFSEQPSGEVSNEIPRFDLWATGLSIAGAKITRTFEQPVGLLLGDSAIFEG